MHRPTSFLVLAALGLVGLLAAARPAFAADWSAAPAANQFGDGRQAFRYTLNPGASADDAVVVTNSGTAPLDLSLRAPRWIEIPRRVTVAPGGVADVAFRVVVPDDARPGDHAGAIAGVPIRLRVGGPLAPRLAVEDVRVDGSRATYVIHNTGNAILSARQSVAVTGPFGRFSADTGRVPDAADVLPGERRNVSVPVRGVVPAVRLTAVVEVLPLLADEAGSTAPLPAVSVEGHAWVVPWWVLVALVAVLVLIAVAIKTRERRAHRRAAGRATRGARRAA